MADYAVLSDWAGHLASIANAHQDGPSRIILSKDSARHLRHRLNESGPKRHVLCLEYGEEEVGWKGSQTSVYLQNRLSSTRGKGKFQSQHVALITTKKGILPPISLGDNGLINLLTTSTGNRIINRL